MRDRNECALKEWAAVEQALATGEVSLLLRKGGLWEQRGGFEVERREFWIFPTAYHQNPDELAPNLRSLIETARTTHPGADRVRIAHYAVVEDAMRVESLASLQELQGLHPLAPESVATRFAYRNRPYLHALVVRVYRMPEPYIIPNTLAYEGCISWVELDQALATHGAMPVLADAEFEALRAEILARLGTEGVVRL